MNRKGVNPRTHGFVMLVALILGIWLKNVHDDNASLESDIELCKISSLNKDTVMMKLYAKIDSLNRAKPDTVFIEKKKPVHKPVLKDTTNYINKDTLNIPNDSIGTN